MEGRRPLLAVVAVLLASLAAPPSVAAWRSSTSSKPASPPPPPAPPPPPPPASASAQRAAAPDAPVPPWCLARAVSSSLDLVSLHDCPAVPAILLLPYLWTPVHVSVKCPSSWYSVYTGRTESELKAKLAEKEVSWCGWEAVLDGTACGLQVSPFTRTFVGVKGVRGCSVTSTARLSPLMVLSGLAGVALFYAAARLSSSFTFRLSCGTLLFTAGSLLFLTVLLLRMLPHKRTMVAVGASMGTTALAAARWLTGQWLPSWHQLVTNRFFGAYVVVSALLGALITYLYDDMANPKVNSVIKATMRLAGLAMVYFATWTSWPVSATVMGLMVASLVGQDVARGVHQTSVQVHRVAQVTGRILSTPFTARRSRRAAAAAAALATPGAATPATGAAQRRGRWWPQAQQQQQQAAPSPGVPLGRRFQADMQAALATPLDDHGGRGADEEGARDGLTPASLLGLRSLRLRGTPPSPWEVQGKRRVKTFEEQMHAALLQQHAAPPAAAAAAAGGRRSARGAAEGPASSGGAAAMAVVHRGGGASGGGGRAGGRAAAPAASDLADDGDEGSEGPPGGVSQVVKQGFILNPATGRLIKVGGDTFNSLLAKGYVADVAAGTMVAPAGAASGGPPSAKRGASGRGGARQASSHA